MKDPGKTGTGIDTWPLAEHHKDKEEKHQKVIAAGCDCGGTKAALLGNLLVWTEIGHHKHQGVPKPMSAAETLLWETHTGSAWRGKRRWHVSCTSSNGRDGRVQGRPDSRV